MDYSDNLEGVLPHYIALDPQTQAVVLVIRGTLSPEDLITDGLCSAGLVDPSWCYAAATRPMDPTDGHDPAVQSTEAGNSHPSSAHSSVQAPAASSPSATSLPTVPDGRPVPVPQERLVLPPLVRNVQPAAEGPPNRNGQAPPPEAGPVSEAATSAVPSPAASSPPPPDTDLSSQALPNLVAPAYGSMATGAMANEDSAMSNAASVSEGASHQPPLYVHSGMLHCAQAIQQRLTKLGILERLILGKEPGDDEAPGCCGGKHSTAPLPPVGLDCK